MNSKKFLKHNQVLFIVIIVGIQIIQIILKHFIILEINHNFSIKKKIVKSISPDILTGNDNDS